MAGGQGWASFSCPLGYSLLLAEKVFILPRIPEPEMVWGKSADNEKTQNIVFVTGSI